MVLRLRTIGLGWVGLGCRPACTKIDSTGSDRITAWKPESIALATAFYCLAQVRARMQGRNIIRTREPGLPYVPLHGTLPYRTFYPFIRTFSNNLEGMRLPLPRLPYGVSR